MKLAHHSMTFAGWWSKNKIPFDLDRLLREVKEAGYAGTELGGSDEKELGKPKELAKKVADAGLGVGAWGVGITANPHPPNTEEYQRAMDYAATVGVKILAVCGGFFGMGRRTTFESDYKLFGENMSAAADYAAKNGQVIAYHPHLGCMVETVAELDRLLRYAPKLKVCVDTGHQVGAGVDVPAMIRKYGKNVLHVHLKDYDPAAYHFTELGQGKAGLDFAATFAALREVGYTGWISVERDAPPISGLESAKISRQFLRSMGL